MPAQLVELVIRNGLPTFRCPVTGRVIIDEEEGFDTDVGHSPHLRFVWDSMENFYVACSEDLPQDQAAYQRELVELVSDDEVADHFDSFDGMVAAAAALMPSSAMVLKLVDPAQGSKAEWVWYVGLDLARLDDEAPESIELVPV